MTQPAVQTLSAEREKGPAPGRAILPDLTDWDRVVEALQVGGLARQLANNCHYDSWDGKTLRLKLDPTHKHLQLGSSEKRLGDAIAEYLGTQVRLVIVPGEATTSTPAQLQAKRKADRQREAEHILADDPLVRAMEERFDARLVVETIKPVDS